MEKVKITLGIAKLRDCREHFYYNDFIKFNEEEEIYIFEITGFCERIIDNEWGEEIEIIEDVFNVETNDFETLSHWVIVNQEKVPTKESILESIKQIKKQYNI